jgi:membrane-bound metal-dependent hydrolase YbcI (DUF457 family)
LPITPYHFGPNGFIGLLFKRWLDLPVLVLANVIVDLEVLTITLLGLGYPVHRYVHTLLIGAVVGALWGLAAYPLRGLWARIMAAYHLEYRPSLGKMVISGILGVWLHVLVDGMQHPDVRILWPNKTFSLMRFAYRYTRGYRMETICFGLVLCTLVLYGFLSDRRLRRASRDDRQQLLR